jgi:hypothetical protein
MAEDENTIDTTEKKEVKIEIKRKQEENDMKEQEEKGNLGEKRQRDWDSKIVRKKKKKVAYSPYYVPVPYEILQVPNEVIQSQQVQSQQVQSQQVQSQQVQSQQVQNQQAQNQQAQNQQAQRRLRQSNHGESSNPPQPPNKEVTPESDILSTTMHGLIETAKSDVSRSLFLRACCLLGFMLLASVAIAHGILRKNAVSCDVFVMLIFLFLFNLLSLPNAKK